VSLSDPRLRRAALLSSGAWAVHALRFVLAPVDGGEGPGHSYLHAALPALTVLVALAAIGFVTRLVVPRRERSAARSLRADWLLCAAVLLASFVLQESAESLLSDHGPVFAAGGWLGVPLAGLVGMGVALLLRGGRAAVEAGVRGGFESNFTWSAGFFRCCGTRRAADDGAIKTLGRSVLHL